jgi:hypothetical protein
MGCDGGTIPKRDELVRIKKKAEKVCFILSLSLSLSIILFIFKFRMQKKLKIQQNGIIVI